MKTNEKPRELSENGVIRSECEIRVTTNQRRIVQHRRRDANGSTGVFQLDIDFDRDELTVEEIVWIAVLSGPKLCATG
jgi:hypothetical protein